MLFDGLMQQLSKSWVPLRMKKKPLGKKIPKEKKQLGKITYFTRRRPEESRLDLNQKNILKVYNFIRMLDINIIKNFPKSYWAEYLSKEKDQK